MKVVQGENEDGKVVQQWTSQKEAKKIKLAEGIYTMVEIQAPAGYEIAESITFRITYEGKLEIKEKDKWLEKGDAPIVMVDDYLSKSGIPESSNIPNTGDSSIITGYLELMALSLTALLLICKRKRKLEI